VDASFGEREGGDASVTVHYAVDVAQWEREATGERTSAALRHKAAQGEYIGGDAPYGFRVGTERPQRR
jgi:DNA invertase Pin-like site-specific DNA recombinase